MSDPIKPKTLAEQLKEGVKASGGRMVYLPDDLTPDAKNLKEEADKVQKTVVTLNEAEIRLSMKSQDFWLKVREYLAENGYPDIWAKEVSWHMGGAQEGIFVVTIADKQ